ncbi:DMT family transporter [Flectobacillus rivi]|uniref:DMT family transporter n=1 Tax=Flectobacillus rivi TaxID=2984209 RepID=A0ABT6Z681_9BACT|nr:DMT family transporter [Flectobacillus rivi]MDI9876643.1 DMT family transporter [Flectobacillus rivi]
MSAILYVILTLLVGFCFPIMASSNGILGRSLGSPFVATLAVFQLGSLLLIALIIGTKETIPSWQQFHEIDWKVWAGGCIVILNLITFTVAPSKIGIANMIVIFVAGQIISSVIAEHFGLLRFPIHSISWQRVLGILLLVLGVILVKKY